MREKIYNVIKDLQRGNVNYSDAVDKLCDLHSVILSETLLEVDKEVGKIDEIRDPSGMESVGFINGADWAIEKIKEKMHSV